MNIFSVFNGKIVRVIMLSISLLLFVPAVLCYTPVCTLWGPYIIRDDGLAVFGNSIDVFFRNQSYGMGLKLVGGFTIGFFSLSLFVTVLAFALSFSNKKALCSIACFIAGISGLLAAIGECIVFDLRHIEMILFYVIPLFVLASLCLLCSLPLLSKTKDARPF